MNNGRQVFQVNNDNNLFPKGKFNTNCQGTNEKYVWNKIIKMNPSYRSQQF